MNSNIFERALTHLNFNHRFLLSDKQYLKLLYKHYYHEKLNLVTPSLYRQKVEYLKLYDRNPIYSKLVDKIKMKEFVASKVGSKYVIPLLGVYKTFNEIDFSKLPKSFVLKANADSGSVFVIKDKTNYDFSTAKRKLNKSLKVNYYYHFREWPYKNVKRLIFAEKTILDSEQNDALVDYKWFCFNGVPTIMYIGRDRGKQPTTDFFDTNFNHLDLVMKDPNSKYAIPKPCNFDKMKEIATILSKGIPLIRVDFYCPKDEVYVGELTFYHNGGFVKMNSEIWETYLGSLIDLSLCYKNQKQVNEL
jgi:hypothetical protein